MTRLPCPLCGKKVDASPTGWAIHLISRCVKACELKHSVWSDDGGVTCPCGHALGYTTETAFDLRGYGPNEAISKLAEHFHRVKIDESIPGRKFNLTEHLLKNWFGEGDEVLPVR
jgi:hypothetical protein